MRGASRRTGRWTLARRCVQSAFALFFVAAPFLAVPWLGGSAIALRLGPVDVIEPVSALSAALAGGTLAATAVVGALPIVAATLAFGSVFCGWVCPYGLLSEGLDRLRRGPHARWPAPPSRSTRAARFATLAALLALSAALGVPLAAALAPPRLLSALPIEARVLAAIPWVTSSILGAVLLLDLAAGRRIVCRVLCPAGAGAALIRLPRTWRPRFAEGQCSCGRTPACHAACNWGLDPRRMAWSDGCTACLACIEACPSGALSARRPDPARRAQ